MKIRIVQKAKNSYDLLLFIANSIFYRIAESMYAILLIWLTYKMTESTLITGGVLAAGSIPTIILGIFSGILADRISKKKLIAIESFGRTILIIILALFYVFSILEPTVLVIVAFVSSLLSILATPARRSILPMIISRDCLLKANSTINICKIVAQLLGGIFGGFVIEKWGFLNLITIVFLSFLFSTITIGLLKGEAHLSYSKRKGLEIRGIPIEIKRGFEIICRERVILKVIILSLFINVFLGAWGVLTLRFVTDILQGGAQIQSVMSSLVVTGVFFISIFLGTIIKKMRILEETAIDLGFLALGLSFVILALSTFHIIAFTAAFINGIAIGLISITSVVILQRDIQKEHLGKVMALAALINESTIPVGVILGAFLSDYFKITEVLFTYGIAIFLVLLLVHLAFKRLKFIPKENSVVEKTES